MASAQLDWRPSWKTRLRSALTPAEWSRLGAMSALIVALHLIGWLTLVLLVEPALNPVWAWIVHGERPSTWGFAGGALILGATAVKTWWQARGGRPAVQ